MTHAIIILLLLATACFGAELPQTLRKVPVTSNASKESISKDARWNFDILERNQNKLYNGKASLEVDYINADTISVTTIEITDIDIPTIEVDTIWEYTAGHSISVESTLVANTIEVDLIRGKTGFPVTVGDTDYDRLEIADDSSLKASIQKIGTDYFSIAFNAFYAGAYDDYSATKHSLDTYMYCGASDAYYVWRVAHPNAPTVRTELMRLTEDGDLYTSGAAWTNYSGTSTVGGFSGTPNIEIYYKKVGKLVFVAYILDGTSNTTSLTFTVPFTASNTHAFFYSPVADAKDNGGYITGALTRMTKNTSVVNVYRAAYTNWTASGNKMARGQLWYETP